MPTSPRPTSAGPTGGAKLAVANLSGANLNSAGLSRAICSWTIFGDVDLSGTAGLDSVDHNGPSIIGTDTLFRSQGKIPEAFLRGCGVPDVLITFHGSLTGAALEFYSCFISFTEADDAFSKRLYNDLQGEGVRCWR